jgi:hypothetical protein
VRASAAGFLLDLIDRRKAAGAARNALLPELLQFARCDVARRSAAEKKIDDLPLGGWLFVWFGPFAWIEHIDRLTRVIGLQKGRLWVIWKDANLTYESIAGIFQGVLHARRQDEDIATSIRLRAGFRSTLTIPLKDHNYFFRFVKMPRDYHSWANDVLMDIGLRTEFPIRDEISNSSLWATRYLAQYSTKNRHDCAPSHDLQHHAKTR